MKEPIVRHRLHVDMSFQSAIGDIRFLVREVVKPNHVRRVHVAARIVGTLNNLRRGAPQLRLPANLAGSIGELNGVWDLGAGQSIPQCYPLCKPRSREQGHLRETIWGAHGTGEEFNARVREFHALAAELVK